jgi:Ser/Thr protein kinase RdoA (MazF antagonist)
LTLSGALVTGDAAAAIAQAFGLSQPIRDLVPHRYRTSPTWLLETRDARFLVKLVPVAGREEQVQQAALFERQVAESGVDTPRVVLPVGEAVGSAAAVDGVGWVRVYQWVDGRDLHDDDDVTHWLARTLATIHAIEPVTAPEPFIYGLHPSEQWNRWLEAGERAAKPWAPVLRGALPAIREMSGWISAALNRADDYVLTHRDVEPWNVMMAADGPVLIDWDPAGPDSASLETCHAAYAFATRGSQPKPGRLADDLAATITAYIGAGGTIRPDGDLFARRIGMRINRLGWRLSISVGAEPLGPNELSEIDRRAVEQIQELPEFARRLRRLGQAVAAQL